jgi:hypothetical protein
MSIRGSYIIAAIGVGIGATLIMDLWNLLLRRGFDIPSLDYCLLGRWLRHMPSGTFRHANIRSASRRSFECQVGWSAHYFIGVVFALVFIGLSSGSWLARPTFVPALAFGICTVVFPFFVMQPSIGLGIASSKTPNASRARLKSLATHTVFGLGLYLCGVGASYLVGGA